MKCHTTFFKNALLAGLIAATGCATPSLNSGSTSFEQLTQVETGTTAPGQNDVLVFERSNPLRQSPIQLAAATEELPKKKGLPPIAKLFGGFFGGSKTQGQPTEVKKTVNQPVAEVVQPTETDLSPIQTNKGTEFGKGTLAPVVSASLSDEPPISATVTHLKSINNPALQPVAEAHQIVRPQSRVPGITPALKTETKTATSDKMEQTISGFLSKLKSGSDEKKTTTAIESSSAQPTIVKQALPVVQKVPRISVARNDNATTKTKSTQFKTRSLERIPSEKELDQLTETVFQSNQATGVSTNQVHKPGSLTSALKQALTNHYPKSPSKVAEVAAPQVEPKAVVPEAVVPIVEVPKVVAPIAKPLQVKAPQVTEVKTVKIAQPIVVTPKIEKAVEPMKSVEPAKPIAVTQVLPQPKVIIPYYNPLRDGSRESSLGSAPKKLEASVVENKPPPQVQSPSPKSIFNRLKADQAKAAADKAEAERKQAEFARIEQEKIDLANAEKAKQESLKAELARKEQARLELAKAAKAEQAKKARERADFARAAEAKQALERAKFERAERGKAELARLKQEQAELARIKNEKLERARNEQARTELARAGKLKNDRLRLFQHQVHSGDSIVSRLKQSRQWIAEHDVTEVKSSPKVVPIVPATTKVTPAKQDKETEVTTKTVAPKLPVILPTIASSVPLKKELPQTNLTPKQIEKPRPSVYSSALPKTPISVPTQPLVQPAKKPLVIENPAKRIATIVVKPLEQTTELQSAKLRSAKVTTIKVAPKVDYSVIGLPPLPVAKSVSPIVEPAIAPVNPVISESPAKVVEIISPPKQTVTEPTPVKVATKLAKKPLPKFLSFWSSSKAKPIPKEEPMPVVQPTKAKVAPQPEVEVANRPLPPVMTVEQYLDQNKKPQASGKSGTPVYVIGSD
ncbi:MAG: hypothetical protein COA78_08365 [Blastopirellula sp.]|nr:MAG: hypothetical protein COA78_08365 [Blastopirellula sp.]